jgi:hypothetical protein
MHLLSAWVVTENYKSSALAYSSFITDVCSTDPKISLPGVMIDSVPVFHHGYLRQVRNYSTWHAQEDRWQRCCQYESTGR